MATQTNAPLPEGLEVGGYRIVRKIASGGFSIVYLADDSEGQSVALKEYLPSSLVKRSGGELIPFVSAENLPTYHNGLKCFFEEGRSLARILHPNVVRVLNFFRANDTVYMVMAYERGRSLQELIIRFRGKPGRAVLPERHIRRIFSQVMNGLREVHANRLLHLDLKPANVYLRQDGSPMLLDFGASRQTLTQDAPKLFPMYTPGFAAPELYRRNQNLGPWTDIYGLGATMYACMIGSPPQPADQRGLNDKVDTALQNAVQLYSQQLVDIVHWCLKQNPLERPQSVFVLQKALREPSSTPAVPIPSRPAGFSRWLDSLSNRRRATRSDSTVTWPTNKTPT
ncbi:MAG: serine/threonine-protein kinase [Burkholderiales bacterium]|jgi:serine/threonine protein kinase|nr:serine/threonine-protein kinase [Burkholderiales bacterium]